MKKIISMLLCAAVFAGASYSLCSPAVLADSVIEVTEESDDYIEETPSPEATEEPSETAPPVIEDYTGVDNPEDNDDETGINSGIVSGEAGAAGGLGFNASKFPDCRGHWAEAIIVECTDNNYLDGYEDGNFYPDRPVTASEFAKIFSAWRGSFFQLTNGYWATPYIIKMLDDGIFEEGDYSDYDVPMTRAQVAKAIINSLKSEFFPSDLDKYKELIPDLSDAGEEFEDYIVKAYMAGIITGYDDGTIRPSANVTRAEILSIINRAVNPNIRQIPEAVSEISGGAVDSYTHYSAAVHVRKTNNANSMSYSLYGKNSQYMTQDDAASSLKMSEEMQGQQGFAFLMRYDLTDILDREDELQSVSLIMNHESWGDLDLGLFWYERKISDTDWNNSSYMKVVNGSAVASDDKAGYNSVVDNISAILPTWGDSENAVEPEEKTQPFAQAKLENGQYYFELSLDELKEHMDENNMVEFFVTTVNYDGYGLTEENKPKCYVAGEKAPQLYCTYNTGEVSRTVRILAESAAVEGGMLNILGTGEDSYIENFRQEQKITFNFNASLAGKYKMTIYYSANVNSGGGTVTFDLNGNKFDHEFAQTGGWAYYVYEDLGEVELKAGRNTLILTDKEIPNTYLINIKNISFEKID